MHETDLKFIESSIKLYEVQLKGLYAQGIRIAEREGYKTSDGLEAIQQYLMKKHHWLPSQVRSMSIDDLAFAMSEED